MMWPDPMDKNGLVPLYGAQAHTAELSAIIPKAIIVQRVYEALEVLTMIAAPKRPDGTWNRDREACRQLADGFVKRYWEAQ